MKSAIFLTGYKQCFESLGFRTNPLQQPRVSEAWDRPYVRQLFLSTPLSFHRKIILLIYDLNLSLKLLFQALLHSDVFIIPSVFNFFLLGVCVSICPLCLHDISVSVASQVYGDFSNVDNFLNVIKALWVCCNINSCITEILIYKFKLVVAKNLNNNMHSNIRVFNFIYTFCFSFYRNEKSFICNYKEHWFTVRKLGKQVTLSFFI